MVLRTMLAGLEKINYGTADGWGLSTKHRLSNESGLPPVFDGMLKEPACFQWFRVPLPLGELKRKLETIYPHFLEETGKTAS